MNQPLEHVHPLRVRYSETDQMGTFYNSRALEWFEVGRGEWLRQAGRPYAEMESAGVMLPLTESYVRYEGRAAYDDLLMILTTAHMPRKARLRFDLAIRHDDGRPVCSGYTVHAIADVAGRPIRPPQWLVDLIQPRSVQGACP